MKKKYWIIIPKIKVKLAISTNKTIEEYIEYKDTIYNDYTLNRSNLQEVFVFLCKLNIAKFVIEDQNDYYNINTAIKIDAKKSTYSKEQIKELKSVYKKIKTITSKIKFTYEQDILEVNLDGSMIIENTNYANKLFIGKNTYITKPKYKVNNLSYQEYLNSKQWKMIREKILNRDNNKCTLCNEKENLHIHHKGYKNLFKETEQDLITLCEDCHNKEHQKIKETGLNITQYYLKYNI